MSSERRHRNPGKREREAGKRHGRARIWCSNWGSGAVPLKRGSRHFGRGYRRALAVADSRKSGGAICVMSLPADAPQTPNHRIHTDGEKVILDGTAKCPECGFSEKHLARCSRR